MDTICTNFSDYHEFYDSHLHFCSATSMACSGDNPVMAIDSSNTDKPYWYIIGLFHYVEKCFSTPQIFTKIIPIMDWIQDIISSN